MHSNPLSRRGRPQSLWRISKGNVSFFASRLTGTDMRPVEFERGGPLLDALRKCESVTTLVDGGELR
jgi:hypothetical protein